MMKVRHLLVGLALSPVLATQAAQFQAGENTTAAIDVTVTYGAQWRLDDPDANLVADPNLDDANRNFESGLASNGIRAIADFELRHNTANHSFGLFARANAWYDNEVYDATTDHNSPVTANSWQLWGGTNATHNEFHPDAEDRSGADIELLDLFLFAELGIASDHPATLRVGRQVINWGESAFIQNGLSAVINSADVSKASLPGTEVKEILRPLGAVSASIAANENISFSAYYQYEWEEIIAPPHGTFLSDVPDPLSGAGGEKFLLPVGAVAAQLPADGLPAPQDPTQFNLPFIPVDRIADRDASDSGQWGVSMSWYLPDFSDTELGFYVGNYHRKRLTLGFTNFRGEQNIDWFPECLTNAGPAALTCVPLAIAAAGFDQASYQLDYQEDIEYFGVSWNSMIGLTQTAFSGEIIYHKDVPIQTLSLLQGLVPTVVGGLPLPGNPNAGQEFSTNIFSRQDMIVTQVTFNQDFNPSWVNDAALIVEIGHIYVDADDNASLWIGNTPADSSSWAYRARFSATWYDGIGKRISALSGTDLIWYVDFNHDVNGVSPVIGTGFVEGAKAFSTGLEATWQNTWSAEIRYTNFFGDGYDTLGQELGDHVLGDRDFLSLAVKFRF